jgi:hypothetical protein
MGNCGSRLVGSINTYVELAVGDPSYAGAHDGG